MTKDNRPLSPHIQIYKPQITSFTSILHRVTGVTLYLGLLVICFAISYYAYQINTMPKEGFSECECVWGNILKYALYA
ncbi:MAG: succinate dehydrogenase, cytochrome b556 subunit, partial [Proteobacteria bacterium]|nr:succinate dehydrogenase, cytochrome b556 subunit [Pseudomonadota bacterium]